MKKICVIAIPDRTRIIINFGKKDYTSKLKLEEDDEVRIVQELTDIIDPSTNLSLGSYFNIKANLTITDVFDNYSIARDKTIINNVFALSPMLNSNGKTNFEKLNVDTNSMLDLPDIEKQIQIGDIVIPK